MTEQINIIDWFKQTNFNKHDKWIVLPEGKTIDTIKYSKQDINTIIPIHIKNIGSSGTQFKSTFHHIIYVDEKVFRIDHNDYNEYETFNPVNYGLGSNRRIDMIINLLEIYDCEFEIDNNTNNIKGLSKLNTAITSDKANFKIRFMINNDTKYQIVRLVETIYNILNK